MTIDQLKKLLVGEIRDVFFQAKILTRAQANGMSKPQLLAAVSDLSNAQRRKFNAMAEELHGDASPDDELVIDLDDLDEEIKSTVEQALANNEDMQKMSVFLDKAHLLLNKRKAQEIVEQTLANIKMPRQGPQEITIKQPIGDDVKVEGQVHSVYKDVLQLVSQRMNVMLVGPSGTGKTHLAEQVAEGVKARAFAALSCSVGMSESQIQGWLLPVESGGMFSYVPAPFVDIAENGGVFLLDEMDNADENMLVLMNMFLSNGSMFLPQRHENPVVKRHEDCIIMAAANTYGTGADAQYVGRTQLDAATLDRFRIGMIYMDYDEDVEAACVDEKVLSWGRRIREGINNHGIRRIMSTRTLKNITVMKAAYPDDWGSESKWNDHYFTDWTRDEKQMVGV